MRYLTIFSCLFLTISLLSGCSESDLEASNSESSHKTSTIQSITALDAARLFVDKQAIIVDVREKNEWDRQHIPGAIHIPLAQLKDRLVELEQHKLSPIIMQCQKGGRSAQGAVLLNTAGFSPVYNLEGGILSWDKAGLVTGQGK